MSALKRWNIRFVLGLLAATILVVGTLFYVASRLRLHVPLTSNLYGRWDVISAEFNRRVEDRFPLGSLESAMAAELQNEGFSSQDWTSSTDAEHEAVRREDDRVCNVAARIYWRADNGGRLTSIMGIYREEGCL